MGGLSYFGFLGIILGPLILSLLVYILTMYKKFINPQTLKADT
jgi:predicted PurR-regulated permease PerM